MSALKTHGFFLLLGCLTAITNYSFAGTMGNTTDKWRFSIAPYGWMSSLSSDITVKNTSQHIFMPFGKILKEIDFAGEVHLEATRGPWTLMLDPTYIKLSSKSNVGPVYVGPLQQYIVGPIDINTTAQTLLIDGGAFYKAYNHQISATQSLSLEALAGARYLGLKNKLALGFSRAELFPGMDISATVNVLAPIIGARIKQDFSKAHAWLRADVGGFGVDHVNNTWSATAGWAYNISPKIELGIAYRVLKIDITKSNILALKTLMYGPELGFAYLF